MKPARRKRSVKEKQRGVCEFVCVLSGVCGVGLAGPRLSWRSVQSVSSAVLPVGGSVGGSVSVGGVDQCPLSLSLQVLQRCDRLQDLCVAAAHCRSAGSPGHVVVRAADF